MEVSLPHKIVQSSFIEYIRSKSEIVFFLILFFAIFFRVFRYNIGIFAFTTYLTYPMALIFLAFQFLNFIDVNYHKTLFVVYFMFLAWLMYGVITLFFTIAPDESLSTLHLRFSSFLNFYVVTQFLTSTKRFKMFELSLFICLIWNICVAFWEITTFNHLPMSNYADIISFVPTGAFVSENTFASKLLVCSSFLFFVKGKFYRHVAVSVLFLLFVIFCAQGARLAIMVFLPFLMYVFFKWTNFTYKLCLILLCIFTLNALYKQMPFAKTLIQQQIDTGILSFTAEQESLFQGSTRARIETLKIGIEEFVASAGLGTGVGSFGVVILSPQHVDKTMYTINAHFMFVEVLATEGIIGFILLFFIIFTCLLPIVVKDNRFSLFRWKSLSPDEQHVILILLFIIVGTTLIASYRTKFIYWIILGYAYALMFNKPETHDSHEKSAFRLIGISP